MKEGSGRREGTGKARGVQPGAGVPTLVIDPVGAFKCRGATRTNGAAGWVKEGCVTGPGLGSR